MKLRDAAVGVALAPAALIIARPGPVSVSKRPGQKVSGLTTPL